MARKRFADDPAYPSETSWGVMWRVLCGKSKASTLPRCFKGDDGSLDPDLQVTGYGVLICHDYFDGDLNAMRNEYLRVKLNKRRPARRGPVTLDQYRRLTGSHESDDGETRAQRLAHEFHEVKTAFLAQGLPEPEAQIRADQWYNARMAQERRGHR